MSPPPGPRGGGSGLFESFPGPAAGARGVALGRRADLRRLRGRRDKGVGPLRRAPRQQVPGLTHRAEKEERGPRGSRARDAGTRRSRVSTPAGAVSLAPCKCPLVSFWLGEGSLGVSVGAHGGLP